MKDYVQIRIWGIVFGVLGGLALFFPISHYIFGVLLMLIGFVCVCISNDKEYPYY